jgi:N-acetylmuramoyl-L-alanine amidase
MKTIVLDPGHGGAGQLTTYGATGNGLVEKNLVLTIARFAFDYLLKHYDCRVVMTRDSDADISFINRANVARNNNADLFVSFHFNGFHDETANGFETFIYSGSVQSTTIANQHAIHNNVYKFLSRLGIRDRGKKRANFAVLRLPPCSCVLLEYTFITNRSDADATKLSGSMQGMGESTAKGIAEALNLPLKQQTIPEPPAGDVWYRVIAGSYRDRGNAELMRINLAAQGIGAFIEVKK